MTKCIITGPASMLGIALIKECARQRNEVIAVARPGSKRNALIPALKNVKVVECNLEKIEKLPGMLDGKFDVFFHLGWKHTDKEGRIDPILQEENIRHTLGAVKAAKKLNCKTFVGVGSQAEYGRPSGKVNENEAIAPVMAYGAAKYAAETLTSFLCARIAIRHVWLRIFSVYGPHNRTDNMITYCMEKLMKNEIPSLTKCEQQWDYLYCADAARAVYLASRKGRDGAIYNLGSGRTKRLSEYIKTMRDAISPHLKLGFGDIPYPEDQIMHLCADISLINRDTGFVPEVPFEEGIKATIKWYKEFSK